MSLTEVFSIMPLCADKHFYAHSVIEVCRISKALLVRYDERLIIALLCELVRCFPIISFHSLVMDATTLAARLFTLTS